MSSRNESSADRSERTPAGERGKDLHKEDEEVIEISSLDIDLPELISTVKRERSSSPADELVLPLVRIKKESDAETDAAFRDAKETAGEDLGDLFDEMRDIEAEMNATIADADLAALKELGPDDGRRIDIAVDMLEHRFDRLEEINGLKFTEGEVFAIGVRLAARNPEAFLGVARRLNFGFEKEEKIALVADIAEHDAALFGDATWVLGLSNEDLRTVLTDLPAEVRGSALESLNVPGTVGGRSAVQEKRPAAKKKWYARLVDEFRSKEGREIGKEREVARMQAASRELQLAIEGAFPDRIDTERERARVEGELNGTIEALDDLGADSANAPMWLRFKDRAIPAVYKPRNREKPLRRGIPTGTYANREWLAYQIDKALQLDLVPPTVFRDGPEGMGAVQDWKVGAAQVQRHWLLESRQDDASKRELQKLAFFDMVTQNSDRHSGNWLRGPDGKAIAIDHGSTVGKTVDGWDGVRSWPAWAVEGEKVPEELAAKVTRLSEAKEVQRALYGAFIAALGEEEAPSAWREFVQRIDDVLKNGYPTTEQLRSQDNKWVGKDRKARNLYEGIDTGSSSEA